MTPDTRLHREPTSAERSRFEVLARSEAVFDVMLALWSAFGADDKSAEHEVGKRFFSTFRAALAPEVVERIEQIGLSDGSLWPVVLSYVAVNAPAGDDDAVLAWLERGETDMGGAILREIAWSADADALEKAISSRDPDDIAPLIPEEKHHIDVCIERLMAHAPADLGRHLAFVLRAALDTSYAPKRDEWAQAIAASADATRRLASAMEPNELVERITNGLDIRIPLGTVRLVAVPSVTLRPWTLMSDFGPSIVVCHAVSDEHLDHDPEAAPGWLVRFHKALGDEKRLRMLRAISDGGSTLTELTDVLGLAKSTVFHHIGILRAAGLVRVILDREEGGSVYRLRHESFGDAGVQLQKYLEVVISEEGLRP